MKEVKSLLDYQIKWGIIKWVDTEVSEDLSKEEYINIIKDNILTINNNKRLLKFQEEVIQRYKEKYNNQIFHRQEDLKIISKLSKDLEKLKKEIKK